MLVLHNSAEGLPECLASIAPAVERGFAEVLAVDNASPDNSADLVRSVLPMARVLHSESNLLFAGGARTLRGSTSPDATGCFSIPT